MERVRWKVSLSNGETVYEGKGKFAKVEDELSPWNKLIEHIAKNDLHITSLALITDEGQNLHVPSAGTNPRFPLFSKAEKPLDYRFFNAATSARSGVEQRDALYRVIEAVYQDYRLQMWVDANNIKNCWCLVVKND